MSSESTWILPPILGLQSWTLEGTTSRVGGGIWDLNAPEVEALSMFDLGPSLVSDQPYGDVVLPELPIAEKSALERLRDDQLNYAASSYAGDLSLDEKTRTTVSRSLETIVEALDTGGVSVEAQIDFLQGDLGRDPQFVLDAIEVLESDITFTRFLDWLQKNRQTPEEVRSAGEVLGERLLFSIRTEDRQREKYKKLRLGLQALQNDDRFTPGQQKILLHLLSKADVVLGALKNGRSVFFSVGDDMAYEFFEPVDQGVQRQKTQEEKRFIARSAFNLAGASLVDLLEIAGSFGQGDLSKDARALWNDLQPQIESMVLEPPSVLSVEATQTALSFWNVTQTQSLYYLKSLGAFPYKRGKGLRIGMEQLSFHEAFVGALQHLVLIFVFLSVKKLLSSSCFLIFGPRTIYFGAGRQACA